MNVSHCGCATNLVCVCPQRDTEGACKPKVGKLEVALFVNKEVLGLQVAVKDAVAMAVVQPLDQLEGEFLISAIAVSC